MTKNLASEAALSELLNYIIDMTKELHTMALEGDFALVSHFLEMAYLEAIDVRKKSEAAKAQEA